MNRKFSCLTAKADLTLQIIYYGNGIRNKGFSDKDNANHLPGIVMDAGECFYWHL